ncbi:SpoIID/LytB domain-containing protein [Paenibacillus eucommiae]|uniref:Stage II sporulation protein D n=1 Tax=Paenibacillus eucommiae TaxID=1355755 RepID=A0ABS4JAA3_9BACL|nr:SpoIID/LytB domain-containing protein [Paenibacillus eucommiae]MBP1996769.1 stage II sporulation protein D [Paenibacillus eucommiae]
MKWLTLFSRKSALKLTAAVVTAGFLSFLPQPAHAAIEKLDNIRVAFFINTPKYSAIKSAVTLTSTSGLDVGIRDAAAVTKTWVSLTGPATVRSSMDQFGVLMLETTNFTNAKALYSKLSVMAGDSYIISRQKQGKPSYQVFYGSYGNVNEAFSAKEQAMKDPNVAALAKTGVPVITGPFHLQAGTYETEAEAANQVNIISQAGLDADVAIQEDIMGSGKLFYSVWIGSEATEEQLGLVKQKAAQLMPNLQLQPANTASPYLLQKWDVTADTAGTSLVPHYAAGGLNVKAWIHPKQSGITVKERAGRTYRGDIELSTYNGKLAVINEVPFEQYLYGVVSSELGASWPLEALKAQAVAARTYALSLGMKYGIAHVSDTTLDQVYGIQKEFTNAIKAVDDTNGEVLVYNDALIQPVYSSNSGGVTADPSEVWGNPVPYLKSVSSPDSGAEAGRANWYNVKLSNGKTGYVNASYLKNTGTKSAAGLPLYTATEAQVNVRPAPFVDDSANAGFYKLKDKEQVEVLGEQKESNPYSWIRGPYDASFLESKLSAAGVKLQGGLKTLEISKRGPSGRVMEIKANDQVVKVQYPDAFRTLLGGLPSTRFEIVEAGSYNVGGVGINIPGSDNSGGSMYVLSGTQTAPVETDKTEIYAIGGSGTVSPLSSGGGGSNTSEKKINIGSKQILIRGTGFGHGLGMSQWGAKGFAEQGYDYRKILQTYYSGANIM